MKSKIIPPTNPIQNVNTKTRVFARQVSKPLTETELKQVSGAGSGSFNCKQTNYPTFDVVCPE